MTRKELEHEITTILGDEEEYPITENRLIKLFQTWAFKCVGKDGDVLHKNDNVAFIRGYNFRGAEIKQTIESFGS